VAASAVSNCSAVIALLALCVSAAFPYHLTAKEAVWLDCVTVVAVLCSYAALVGMCVFVGALVALLVQKRGQRGDFIWGTASVLLFLGLCCRWLLSTDVHSWIMH